MRGSNSVREVFVSRRYPCQSNDPIPNTKVQETAQVWLDEAGSAERQVREGG